jgi:energy-coupling factor transporter ATP-binding protein EcfA2
MTLPAAAQTRATIKVAPDQARVMLVGTPGSGKTTLAAAWAPKTTLIIDTQGGTILLDGEHMVSHVHDWDSFVAVVKDLTTTQHQYRTVVIDMIDDIWKVADRAFAGKNAPLASATDDWQKSINTAEGMFRQQIGTLLGSPLGCWFLSHAREKQDGNITRFSSELHNKVLTYVQGATQFIFLAETTGPRRVLHTQPSARFEAKSRVPMPEPMELDARALWAAMDRGLNPAKYAKKNGSKPSAVPAAEPVGAPS